MMDEDIVGDEDQDNQSIESNKQKNQNPKDVQEEEIQEHKTLNHNSLYYNFIQRYFTTYKSEKQVLYQHSNGLFLIGVNLEGFKSKPVKINDVLKFVEVKGKRKRGGVKVHKNTVLIEIECENGVEKIFCMVEGSIIQRNAALSIQNLGKAEGYVAVIMPSKKFKPDPLILTEVPPLQY